MRAVGLLIVVFVALSSGCATDSEFNQLWRQGHGFNNPNVDRIRNGLPPEDF